MSEDDRVYLDTSALAKWYLNEPGSDVFAEYLQGVDVAVISRLTRTEMRSLLSRRRRMGELSAELESVLYAAFLDDIARGWLQDHPVNDVCFDQAVNLMTRYPEHPLRTLDALHLALANHLAVEVLATADCVMAEAASAMGLTVRQF
ncbi:type II toxin-antitoxin system VapC family toxin [Thiocapsa bogorovii]|uniref:type II toxin-antitoxin system VapC family toxin n=1 Tax=Thiocapsa bogorovii TaxID=521689 RepID=UPI001E5B6795|nr:type II toxin-antitoxin system VapC family toxin [Thiocapsa bogorovii]UHD16907.1 type II toxin-antitoxin system VapC family toxin [Thiocapsa bogorovii]